MQEKGLQLDGLHAGYGNIRSRYSLITDDGANGSGIVLLCVGFDGTYQYGADDARYMRGCLRTALNKWPCRGLILDLSGLRYERGNDMDSVLSINRSPPWLYSGLQVAAITSSINDSALRARARKLRGVQVDQLLTPGKPEAVATLVRRIKSR